MEKQCDTCGIKWFSNNRHRKCGKCRYNKIPKKNCYCCGSIISKNATLCRICNSKKRSGEGNPNWKNGIINHAKGYIMQYAPEHPRAVNNHGRYVFQHILVMEEKLGRFLLPNENVHHKNGDKGDNRVENLELWVKNQPNGQRVEDLVKWALEILDLYNPYPT